MWIACGKVRNRKHLVSNPFAQNQHTVHYDAIFLSQAVLAIKHLRVESHASGFGVELEYGKVLHGKD